MTTVPRLVGFCVKGTFSHCINLSSTSKLWKVQKANFSKVRKCKQQPDIQQESVEIVAAPGWETTPELSGGSCEGSELIFKPPSQIRKHGSDGNLW